MAWLLGLTVQEYEALGRAGDRQRAFRADRGGVRLAAGPRGDGGIADAGCEVPEALNGSKQPERRSPNLCQATATPFDFARGGYLPGKASREVIVMVMRYDPLRDIDRQMQQLMGRMQDTANTMAMDAYRRGDSVLVHFDLPGVDAESIEVTAEQNTLTVRAERRWMPESDDQILAQERPQGSFMRQLMLGEHLDTQQIQAAYENGVLTIEVPVTPAAKPRKIEVNAAGQQRGAIDVEATSGGDPSQAS
jgi:HSP20 family protein